MHRPTGPSLVVIDGGIDPAPERAVTGGCWWCVRATWPCDGPCTPAWAGTDGIVVVEEPQRSLTRADIEGILARPVLAAVAVTADMARLIDAGLLALRPPGLALAGTEPASAPT